jgi:Zn-dependent M16 (insulinase) family peptidase
MIPDPEFSEREEAAEKKRLQDARSSMGSSGIGKVLRDTAALKKQQETPDPPEALASIPSLTLADLPRHNRPIPSETIDYGGTKIYYHNLFTHKIVYLDVGMDLHTLPGKYLPYSPLFGRALLEMGTEKEDFVALSQRIGRKTGGIHSALFTSAMKGSESAAVRLFFRGKAMMGQEMELLDVLKDVFLHTRLDNQERFRQMVFEEKARQERMIVPSGHQLVNLRLRAHFTESDWAAEQMKGVSQLLFIRSLARRVEEDWATVLEDLETLRHILCNRNGWVVNVTLDKLNWNTLQIPLKAFIESFTERPVPLQSWTKETPPPYEGLTIPAQVNYVGMGADLYAGGYRFHGSALVISRYLRNTFLWDQVRVRGGAYGAFCLFDRLSGTLCLISYRDPNLLPTLQVFHKTPHFLRDLDLTDKELTKAIIGTIGDIDQYRLPDAKGYISMARSLSGDREEGRQQMREEVLSTSRNDFLVFAEALEGLKQHGLVTILGPQNAIESVLQEKPGWIERLDLL